MTANSSVQIVRLDGFDDSRLTSAQWSALLARGDTKSVFLTWEWQRAWWDTFARGKLLVIAARRHGEWQAVAPLFADAGMVFFTGSGGSDYLDFIGDVSDPAILVELLRAARNSVEGFLGFRFYHVPDKSRTGKVLSQCARHLHLGMFDEGDFAAPKLNLAQNQESAEKENLVRREHWFRREGQLRVEHFRDAESIKPCLPAFFDQHIARWSATPYPSLFNDPMQRRMYERITALATNSGWLRFTRVTWNDRPIAFHYGFCYRNSYLWYKPAFAVEFAKRSPGSVLLRQLLLAAMAEGATEFDFGLGDEAFKSRFSTHVEKVRTWGLYPLSTCSK